MFWCNMTVMDECRNRGSLDEFLIGIVSDKDFAGPAERRRISEKSAKPRGMALNAFKRDLFEQFYDMTRTWIVVA